MLSFLPQCPLVSLHNRWYIMLVTGLCLPCWCIPVGCCVQATSLAWLWWCGEGWGGWAVRRLTDLKAKETVDDNGAAEREANRAEIRWCFVDVLKIRRREMKQTCDFIPLFMNCGITRLHAGTAHEEWGWVAFSEPSCQYSCLKTGCYCNLDS